MAAPHEDLEGWAIIGRAPGLHIGHLRAAGDGSCDPRALFDLSANDLTALGLPPAAIGALRAARPALVDSDLRWLQRSGARLLPFTCADYPAQLARIDSAPAVLYLRGSPEALRQPQLAMVGSRNPTAAGQRTAKQFAACFARAGLVITSGLARGIDAASHSGALGAGGRTVAVCGTGLDRVYPREHTELAQRIVAQGALVSEFPPGTVALPANFPRRNRLISGLSRGTLVVEAARGSGSLITARLAAEQGREVFAIPGSIHSALSRGCHELLREGAKLVESADDVLVDLKIPIEKQLLEGAWSEPSAAPITTARLDKDYEMLLDALGFQPASVDMLVDRTGLPGESVASMLLILELAGRIEPQAGGTYSRIAADR